jgi:carbon monoxide dehydrogenase subunit G
VVRLEASGKETRGAGTASATVRSVLEDRGAQTDVVVLTTLNVTGKPAQFGRGVLNDVGGRLLSIFANNLAATLAADGGAAGTAPGTAEADAAAAEPGGAVDDLELPRGGQRPGRVSITTVGRARDRDRGGTAGAGRHRPASMVDIKVKLADPAWISGGPRPPGGSRRCRRPGCCAAPAAAATRPHAAATRGQRTSWNVRSTCSRSPACQYSSGAIRRCRPRRGDPARAAPETRRRHRS